MKKVFLLLASALMGVASFAAEWTYDDAKKEISIAYNSYGQKDAEGTSIQWQAGNQGALIDAVDEATGEIAWTPVKGEAFSVRITGTPNMTGKFQFCIVDERAEVAYYTELTNTYVYKNVVKGQPFELEGVMFIDKTEYVPDKGEPVALTAPGLCLSFFFDGKSTDEGFNSAEDFTLTDATLEVNFAVKQDIENPLLMTNKGKSEADDSKYQYQYMNNSKVAKEAVKKDAYANVTFSGKAITDVSTLMYVLADNSMQKPDSEHATNWYFAQTTKDFVSFAYNIKAGQTVNESFSYKLENGSDPETNEELCEKAKQGPLFVDVILGESTEKVMGLYFENGTISVEITNEPKFDAPKSAPTAVEEVSNVAFENGVIYSSSIVVYNQAGQVVATASDEFAINTLKAGIYFAKTAEGSISFVVK